MNVLFKASPAGLSLKLYIFNSFCRSHDGTWSGEVKLLLCIQTKQLSCNHSLPFCVLSSSGSTVTLRGYKVFRGKNTFQGRGERDVRRIRKPRFSLSKGIWRTAAKKRENDMNNCKVSNMGSGRDTGKLTILWYAPFSGTRFSPAETRHQEASPSQDRNLCWLMFKRENFRENIFFW